MVPECLTQVLHSRKQSWLRESESTCAKLCRKQQLRRRCTHHSLDAVFHNARYHHTGGSLPAPTSISGKPAQKKSLAVRGLHVPNGGLPESMIRPVPMIFFENIDVIAQELRAPASPHGNAEFSNIHLHAVCRLKCLGR